MNVDYGLDELKAKEQEAYRIKQAAWQKYNAAKERADATRDYLSKIWQEVCSARDTMNREHEAMQSANKRADSVWEEYRLIRDSNSSRIDSLRDEANREHHEMQACFSQANSEYEHGDKSLAPVYSKEGREHKERRNALNAEIKILAQEIKHAKERAELRAPRADSAAFYRAKEVFDLAKSHHATVKEKYENLKAERDRYKTESDQAQKEHARLREEYQRRLDEIKLAEKAAQQQMIDKLNTALANPDMQGSGTVLGQGAKVVSRNDGKTDIYFGGANAGGDGAGHGHAVIDEKGDLAYFRDACAVEF